MKKMFAGNWSEGITLKELFEQFLVAKQCVNVSPYTLEYYRGCYNSFTRIVDEGTRCSDITLQTVNAFILALKESGEVNDTTINTYLRGVRAILYYGMGVMCIKPFKIVCIRAEKKQKETYSEAEIIALIQKPDIKTCSFAEFRSWAIVNYLLATGNRLETLLNVKIGDIDFAENEIHLTKLKNRKQYAIPLSAQLSKVLREYLIYRKGKPDDYLFCSSYGNSVHRGTIQKQIAAYNHKRGVQKTSIHAFRHTFAKNWILNGGDILSLQTILGHSSIEMVKEYGIPLSPVVNHWFSARGGVFPMVISKKESARSFFHPSGTPSTIGVVSWPGKRRSTNHSLYKRCAASSSSLICFWLFSMRSS